MNRARLLALTISASLHAAAVAFVLAHRGDEPERVLALAVDIAWSASPESSDGVSAAEDVSTPTSVDSVQLSHHASPAGLTRGSMVREERIDELVESGRPTPWVAGSSPGNDAGTEAAVAGARRSPLLRPETNETAVSHRRRRIDAERRAESLRAESFRKRGASAAVVGDAATATALEQASSHRSGATPTDAAEISALASSNSMAGGAEIVYRVAPTYPVAARRRGIEGAVLLHVRFDAGGRPEDISIMTSSGSKMLDDAARDAVARWRFRGGVAGTLELPITFRLVAASAADESSVNQGVIR